MRDAQFFFKRSNETVQLHDFIDFLGIILSNKCAKNNLKTMCQEQFTNKNELKLSRMFSIKRDNNVA